MPKWPYCNKQRRSAPLFFGVNANLGLLPALLMGFQHAMSMIAGLITPPLIIGFSCTGSDCQEQRTCELLTCCCQPTDDLMIRIIKI